MNNDTLTAYETSTAKWVADLITKDGITAEQFASDPQVFIAAYMAEIGRKITKIQDACLTRDGALSVMQEAVVAA